MFRSTTVVFEIQGCRKSEMHRINSDRPWAFNSWKYPVYTLYLPLRLQYSYILLYGHLFAIQGCEKRPPQNNGNAINDLRMTSTLNCRKYPVYTVLVWGPMKQKWREVWKTSKAIWGRSSVLPRFLPHDHMLAKRKQSWKIVSSKFQNRKTVLLSEPLRRKLRRSVKILNAIWGWSSVLKVLLQQCPETVHGNEQKIMKEWATFFPNIHKKKIKNKNSWNVWSRLSNYWSLKEIRPTGSDIIATRTMDDIQMTNRSTITILTVWPLLTHRSRAKH